SGGPANVLRFGRLEIDRDARIVRLEDAERTLTGYQFTLLVALAERAGRVLSRDALMDLVKGEALEAFDRSIDVHISRIRAAIEDDPKRPRRILTVRGAVSVFASQQDLCVGSICVFISPCSSASPCSRCARGSCGASSGTPARRATPSKSPERSPRTCCLPQARQRPNSRRRSNGSPRIWRRAAPCSPPIAHCSRPSASPCQRRTRRASAAAGNTAGVARRQVRSTCPTAGGWSRACGAATGILDSPFSSWLRCLRSPSGLAPIPSCAG